jgi:hypothetical protein
VYLVIYLSTHKRKSNKNVGEIDRDYIFDARQKMATALRCLNFPLYLLIFKRSRQENQVTGKAIANKPYFANHLSSEKCGC